MLPVLLLACAPPFDQTRKDLEDFRLVGMRWDGTPSGLAAAVWSGEGAFHTTAPSVTWTLADDAGEARVIVEDAAGHVEQGLLVRAEGAVDPVVTTFERTITADGAALSLTVDSAAVTRWMASGGTFTETGPNSADWVTDDAPLTTVFALTLDGQGGNTWNWIDIATDDGPYFGVGGRLLPIDTPVSAAGDYLATLTAADNHAGLVLTDLTPADAAGDIVCGLDPFDADALVDGRCGLDEALGARVRLTGAPWP